MSILYSENLVYLMIGDIAEQITAIPPLDYNNIVSIKVPAQVRYHNGPFFYSAFNNLQELIASPKSTIYETHDGTLCKSGEILYIPKGKTSLYIDSTICRVGYLAFADCCNLSSIVLDPNNQYFSVVNNCLYNKDITKLYFVPYSCYSYVIPNTVTWISETIKRKFPAEIHVESGNQVYAIRDGILYENNNIIHIMPGVNSLHLSENAGRILCDMYEIETITADEDNELYTCFNNVLYDKLCAVVIYIPSSVDEITIFPKTKIPKDFSSMVKKEICKFRVLLDDKRTVSFTCKTSELRQCVSVLRSGKTEVKPGTEYMFCDLYLNDQYDAESFLRYFKLSIMQILYRVISDNNIDMMYKILQKGGMVTRNNIKRLMRRAEQEEKTEIHQILTQYQFD